VNNVAPVITGVTGPTGSLGVGAAANVTANFTDAGTLDTHSCSFSWGDTQTGAGSLTEAHGSGSCAASHSYTTPGVYTVSVTVTDKDGDSATNSTLKVTVVNTLPSSLSVAATPTSINEGGTTTVNGSFTDPDNGDTHTVVVDWGDGSSKASLSLAAGVLTFSASHTYLNNSPAGKPSGTFAISVSVADSSGSTSGSSSVTVNDTAAVITGTSGYSHAVAGVSVNISGTYKDAGVADTHTCSFNWGDLQTSAGTVTESNGSGSCSASHAYANAGTYSASVTVTDNDGLSGTAMFNVTVNPKATISSATFSPTSVYEGSPASLRGSISDADTAATHTLTIAWGDGTSDTINLGAGVTSFAVNHTYLNNGPKPASPLGPAPSYTYKAQITMTSNYGGSGSASASVTVNNANPVITSINGPTSLNLALSATGTFTVNFTDPGALDIHFCSFTWGDKHSSQPMPTESNGKGTCTATYKYTTAGTYTIGVSVGDDDGGRVTSSYQVVVSTR